jgi:hypothetical protein
MALSTYSNAGFAALVRDNKAQIIGAVQSGQTYAVFSPAVVVFNLTENGLRADLIASGYSLLN